MLAVWSALTACLVLAQLRNAECSLVVEVQQRAPPSPDWQQAALPNQRRGPVKETVKLSLIFDQEFGPGPASAQDCETIDLLIDESSTETMQTFNIQCTKRFNTLVAVSIQRPTTNTSSVPVDLFMPEVVKVSFPSIFQETVAPKYFPIYRWVSTGESVIVHEGDTFLPANDPNPAQRTAYLARQRLQYTMVPFVPGLPTFPFVASVPSNEWFDTDYAAQWFGQVAGALGASAMATGASLGAKPFTRLRDAYRFFGSGFEKPEEGFSSHISDTDFSLQRTQGANPHLIRLVKGGELARFKLDFKIVSQYTEDYTSLVQAVRDRKIFVVDHTSVADIVNQNDGDYFPAPAAFFFLRSTKELVPIAIHSDITKGKVFYPSDGYYQWMNAKMWFNMVDSNLQEVISHLGSTHFLMEMILGGTHRTLSVSHPVWKMLKPHFRYVIPQNRAGFQILLLGSETTPAVFSQFAIGNKRVVPLFAHWRKEFNILTNGHFVNDLTERGVISDDVLPGYRARDDGMLYWEAVKEHVSTVIHHYYDHPRKMRNDEEMQNWNRELGHVLNIGGFPGGRRSLTIPKAIEILTSIIFRSSVYHASVNNAQNQEFSLVTNYPSILRSRDIDAALTQGATSEAEIMEQIVPMNQVGTLVTANLLVAQDFGTLGGYEKDYAFPPTAVAAAVQTMRKRVKTSIESSIEERNELCSAPYTNIHPTRVPNAPSL